MASTAAINAASNYAQNLLYNLSYVGHGYAGKPLTYNTVYNDIRNLSLTYGSDLTVDLVAIRFFNYLMNNFYSNVDSIKKVWITTAQEIVKGNKKLVSIDPETNTYTWNYKISTDQPLWFIAPYAMEQLLTERNKSGDTEDQIAALQSELQNAKDQIAILQAELNELKADDGYENILLSIKTLLGLSDDNTDFDASLITYINSAIFSLRQLGVGPLEKVYTITQGNAKIITYRDYLGEAASELTGEVKTYIYYKVLLSFDPPSNGSVLATIQSALKESEWRLTANMELPILNRKEEIQNGV